MALGEYIGASRDAMTAVRRIVERRDWTRLDTAVEFYGESFSRLRHYLERFGTDGAAEKELSSLRQLEIMHRKVMRQLSRHMQHTREDMAEIDRLLQ